MAIKPSLRVLADACGVSTSTVSRALSGHPSVRPQVRETIAAAAQRHGYQRNELVGQLMSHVRTARSQQFLGNLAVIHVPSPGQPRLLPAQRRIMAGAAARAKELGFQLYEFSAGRDGLRPDGYARVLRARGVQGVIFLYTEPTGLMADFPWSEFASIEIDYGQREPALHTVCLDHYMTLTSALTRLQGIGYRRIGLFVSKFKDERISYKWSGAFGSFQRSFGAIGEVPQLVLEQMEEKSFLHWYREHRPDLVVGHVDEAVVWLQRAGVRVPAEAGFFSLSWTERKRPCAGLDLRLELQGEVAAETVISQIHRGESGLPADPQTIMVRGRWVDGPTLAVPTSRPH
ncbi:MAG: LacI family DNA-binding transcriptional regulator [Verrucomicrobia bacterium]|nr:LacI family DNA-binding transcriptional regulator [Verrucomicrobiota bacterium]